MGILKKIKNESFVDAEYWNIGGLELVDCKFLQVRVNGYISQEAYLGGARPISNKGIAMVFDKKNSLSFADIYKEIKAQGKFSDAQDILEDEK